LHEVLIPGVIQLLLWFPVLDLAKENYSERFLDKYLKNN
jgi:hypothetical protein